MVKVEVSGEVFFTDEPCQWLDPQTKLCTVYDRRFEVCHECITVALGVAYGAMPDDCPYVRDIPDYRGPRPFSELRMRYGAKFAAAAARSDDDR